jgi:hypothetical protein
VAYHEVRTGDRGGCAWSYLDCASAGHNVAILDRTLYHHDSVMETPLNLLDELLRTTAKKECARPCLGTVRKDIEPLTTNLTLLESATGAEMFAFDI